MTVNNSGPIDLTSYNVPANKNKLSCLTNLIKSANRLPYIQKSKLPSPFARDVTADLVAAVGLSLLLSQLIII